jgi:hypothetical protein
MPAPTKLDVAMKKVGLGDSKVGKNDEAYKKKTSTRTTVAVYCSPTLYFFEFGRSSSYIFFKA